MMFSLNEVEAMGKRAARGAGLPWGLAEEAGKAARWLAAQGLPGADLLLTTLEKSDGRSPGERAPVSTAEIWRAPTGQLCPLVTGSALGDRASEMADGRTIILGPTRQPLLLVPYLAAAAKTSETAFQLTWDDVILLMDADTLSYDDDNNISACEVAQAVRCSRTTGRLTHPQRHQSALDVRADVWAGLNAFAMRTFAPATEASRIAGAGAGLADND